MNRVVLRPWCRPEVFRSVYTPGASIPRRAFPAQSIYNANGRHFASVSRWHNKQSPETPPASTPELSETSNAALENETTNSSPHVPWYLQEASPVSESQISSRDQLPDLPEQSPEILPVLLEYVFKDLGLDNLNLMDLRPLETPPPLGANVIMIIGTARSVKHLNVSADRLCRWLRTKWELSPYADGLLGRNELKIKLRRKARRARIASQSGAMVDEKDDGITTGWICVNAGVVEKSAAPEPGAQNFEGFGTVVGGTRVVVQMFTEEKRAEVDLEGLWQKTLDRAEREKKKYAEANPSAPPKEVRSSSSTNPSPSSSSHSDLDYGHPTRTPVTPPFGQRRQIHSGRPRIPFQAMQGTANTPIPSPFRSSVRGYSTSQESDLVNALLQYLSGLPDEQVQKDLGTGPDDTSSTPFLQLFHGNISRFFEHEKEFAKLKLYCTAIYRNHPGYSKLGLAKTFEYHAALGRVIPDDLSFEIVSALLAGQPTGEPAEGGGVKMTLPREDIEVALDVLEHLSTQGTNLMNLKMFNIIYKAAMIIPDQVQPQTKPEKEAEAEEPTSNLPDQDKITISALYRVSRMIDAFDFPFDATETRLHMALRFQSQDYDGFWKIWRQLPIYDKSRTQKDYEMMFEAHARLGDPVLAESCLTEWFPMMSREKYPIPLEGQLRESVLECILLADPDVKKNSMNQLNRPMVRIWNECHQRREVQHEYFY